MPKKNQTPAYARPERAPSNTPLYRRILDALIDAFDSRRLSEAVREPRRQETEATRWLPYIVLHLGCVGILWAGCSWTAVAVALGLYVLRMFAVTGFYHRYFSHRTFKTSRFMQFVFAVWGNAAAQRGPVWWACHHRQHHEHSDDVLDAHSPVQHGFYWSHIGWLTARDNLAVNGRYVRDLLRFPELRFLDRFDLLVPLALIALLWITGALLHAFAPGLGTSGLQLVVWGFFVSTVVLFHATCCINSLTHMIGRRRYETTDGSRNSLLLALLTLGEGWHNNHHRYPASVRQGFYWWEIDLTYYGLWLFARLGLIWDLKPVPHSLLVPAGARRRRAARERSSAGALPA